MSICPNCGSMKVKLMLICAICGDGVEVDTPSPVWHDAKERPDGEDAPNYAKFENEFYWSVDYWCKTLSEDEEIYYGVASYDMNKGEWFVMLEGKRMVLNVLAWQPLPQPPESEGE